MRAATADAAGGTSCAKVPCASIGANNAAMNTHRLLGLRECIAIVNVPVALEEIIGIVHPFLREEFPEAGIAALDLGDGRISMIGKEVASPKLTRRVDQRAEGVRGARPALFGVRRPQV